MPFLGSALGYLIAMWSPGWENLVAFDWNDVPVDREFDFGKFLKNVKPHPMPCLPPGFTLMGALSLDWTVTVRILSSLEFFYWRKSSQSSLRMVELVNFHRHSQYHDGNERMKKGRIQNMDPWSMDGPLL